MSSSVSREDLVSLVWDLRDQAFDHPETWRAVTAEMFLQRLAETLEATEAGSVDGTWAEFADALRTTANTLAPDSH